MYPQYRRDKGYRGLKINKLQIIGFAIFFGSIALSVLSGFASFVLGIPAFGMVFGMFAPIGFVLLVIGTLQNIINFGKNPGGTARQYNEDAAKAAGQEGERETAYQLDFLGSEYRTINRQYVSSTKLRQEFDHIVVGPNGVFHIDSKNWGGRIEFTTNGLLRNGRPDHTDPTEQMYRHETVLKELFRENGVDTDVVGIICFTNTQSEVIGRSPAFETIKIGRLLHTIKSHEPNIRLSETDVERITTLIQNNSRAHI